MSSFYFKCKCCDKIADTKSNIRSASVKCSVHFIPWKISKKLSKDAKSFPSIYPGQNTFFKQFNGVFEIAYRPTIESLVTDIEL